MEELKVRTPEFRLDETKEYVKIIGDDLKEEFPWVSKMEPSTNDKVEGVLRRTWKPALSVVGAKGLPLSENAGNVLRPYTELKLSMRIPPMVNHNRAKLAIENTLTKNPPYGSKISIEFDEPASGWSAPETDLWLKNAMKTDRFFFITSPVVILVRVGQYLLWLCWENNSRLSLLLQVFLARDLMPMGQTNFYIFHTRKTNRLCVICSK